jgi:predicted transcriptional regulator
MLCVGGEMRIGEYIIEPEWATNISYHIVRERRMMDLHDLLIDEISKKTDELINEHESESLKCQEQVNEIRQKLAVLIEKKIDMEERVNKLYSFVHGMIGADEMESLDESFLP